MILRNFCSVSVMIIQVGPLLMRIAIKADRHCSTFGRRSAPIYPARMPFSVWLCALDKHARRKQKLLQVKVGLSFYSKGSVWKMRREGSLEASRDALIEGLQRKPRGCGKVFKDTNYSKSKQSQRVHLKYSPIYWICVGVISFESH